MFKFAIGDHVVLAAHAALFTDPFDRMPFRVVARVCDETADGKRVAYRCRPICRPRDDDPAYCDTKLWVFDEGELVALDMDEYRVAVGSKL